MTLIIVIAVALALILLVSAVQVVRVRGRSRRAASTDVGDVVDRVVGHVAEKSEMPATGDSDDAAADDGVSDPAKSAAAGILDDDMAAAEPVDADTVEATDADAGTVEATDADAVEAVVTPSLRERLGKARAVLAGPLNAVMGRTRVTEQNWTEITEALIRADVGPIASTQIVEAAKSRAGGDSADAETAIGALRAELSERLGGPDRSLARREDGEAPTVWLFVGVNGTGKTTTIGKLARQQVDSGAAVMLAAGDTFRAAASEQLSTWAQRSGAQIVQGASGADPASVVFDAVESAAARGVDLVLADTAGRLHTEKNLMAELQKVRRVADKGAGVVCETLLVLDATTGQNGLAQAAQFTEAVDLTGVVLTKLDGSAKGGIVLAVQEQLGVPVKLVGIGEGIGDLVAFDENDFVEALLA